MKIDELVHRTKVARLKVDDARRAAVAAREASAVAAMKSKAALSAFVEAEEELRALALTLVDEVEL